MQSTSVAGIILLMLFNRQKRQRELVMCGA
jgi:hypothetical protein